MSDLNVTFTKDIPKVTRQGVQRTSKYEALLEACRGNEGQWAVMVFEKNSQAISRYQSIQSVIKRQDDEGSFRIHTRSEDGNTNVYLGFFPNEEEAKEEAASEPAPAPAAKKTATKRTSSKRATNKTATKRATKRATAKSS